MLAESTIVLRESRVDIVEGKPKATPNPVFSDFIFEGSVVDLAAASSRYLGSYVHE